MRTVFEFDSSGVDFDESMRIAADTLASLRHAVTTTTNEAGLCIAAEEEYAQALAFLDLARSAFRKAEGFQSFALAQ